MAKQFLDKTGLEALVSEIKSNFPLTKGKSSGAFGYNFNDAWYTERCCMGSVNDGGVWYNFINIRHRGGESDGNKYGIQIRCAFGQLKLEYRVHNNGTWTDWKRLAKLDDLDSYLKLSGGQLNGDLRFPNVNNAGTGKGIYWTGESDQAFIRLEQYDGVSSLVLYIDDDNDDNIKIRHHHWDYGNQDIVFGREAVDIPQTINMGGNKVATEAFVNNKGYQTASQVNTLIDNKIQEEMLVDQGYVLEHCNAVEDKIPTFSYSNGVLTITTS